MLLLPTQSRRVSQLLRDGGERHATFSLSRFIVFLYVGLFLSYVSLVSKQWRFGSRWDRKNCLAVVQVISLVGNVRLRTGNENGRRIVGF